MRDLTTPASRSVVAMSSPVWPGSTTTSTWPSPGPGKSSDSDWLNRPDTIGESTLNAA